MRERQAGAVCRDRSPLDRRTHGRFGEGMKITEDDLIRVAVDRAYGSFRVDEPGSVPPREWGSGEPLARPRRGVKAARFLGAILVSMSHDGPVLLCLRGAPTGSIDAERIQLKLKAHGVRFSVQDMGDSERVELFITTDRASSITVGDGEVVACAWR